MEPSRRRLQKDKPATLVGLMRYVDRFPAIQDESSGTLVLLVDETVFQDIEHTVRETAILRRSRRIPGPTFKIRVTGMLRHNKEASQHRFALEDLRDIAIAMILDETNTWYDVIRPN